MKNVRYILCKYFNNNKFFLTLIISCFCIGLFSQTNSKSPYSRFGYGNTERISSTIYESLGGFSTAYADFDHVNFYNPATYSILKRSLIDFGLSVDGVDLRTSNSNSVSGTSYFSHFAVALPFKKSAVAFGLRPLSTIGYEIQVTEDQSTSNFEGVGALNNAFIGFSMSFFNKFSIGLNANFIFGNRDESITQDNGTQFLTQVNDITNYTGFNVDVGLFYNEFLKNNKRISIGLTHRFEKQLRTRTDESAYTLTVNNEGGESIRDTLRFSENVEGKYKLPSKTNLGIAYTHQNKWLIGFDYEFENYSSVTIREENNDLGLSFKNSNKFSLGGYWIPDYQSFNKYFKRVTYRAGLYFKQSHITFAENSLDDFGITFGVGLPIDKDALKGSNVNFGFQLGRRGSTEGGRVQENYFNVKIGLTFNAIWFRKRKIN